LANRNINNIDENKIIADEAYEDFVNIRELTDGISDPEKIRASFDDMKNKFDKLIVDQVIKEGTGMYVSLESNIDNCENIIRNGPISQFTNDQINEFYDYFYDFRSLYNNLNGGDNSV